MLSVLPTSSKFASTLDREFQIMIRLVILRQSSFVFFRVRSSHSISLSSFVSHTVTQNIIIRCIKSKSLHLSLYLFRLLLSYCLHWNDTNPSQKIIFQETNEDLNRLLRRPNIYPIRKQPSSERVLSTPKTELYQRSLANSQKQFGAL